MIRRMLLICLVLVSLIGCHTDKEHELDLEDCKAEYNYPTCATWCKYDDEHAYNLCLANCEIVGVECEGKTGKEKMLEQLCSGYIKSECEKTGRQENNTATG